MKGAVFGEKLESLKQFHDSAWKDFNGSHDSNLSLVA